MRERRITGNSLHDSKILDFEELEEKQEDTEDFSENE